MATFITIVFLPYVVMPPGSQVCELPGPNSSKMCQNDTSYGKLLHCFPVEAFEFSITISYIYAMYRYGELSSCRKSTRDLTI